MMKESDILKQIMAYLRMLENSHKVVALRNNTISTKTLRRDGSEGFLKNGSVGSADIIVCTKGGYYVALEVKAPKGTQSEFQKTWQERLQKVGGMYHIVRSVEEVEALMKAYLA